MGKTKHKRTDRDFSREQRLSHENKDLKQEILRLRKLLARVDLDKFGQIKETVEKHCKDDNAQYGQDLLDRLKQEWRCTKTAGCEGYLEIIIFNKINDTYYFRRCSECSNRTPSQKYDSKVVRGIIKKTE